MVTEGELVLAAGRGRIPACAPATAPPGRPATRNGHCFLNRTDREARFLVVGSKVAARGRHLFRRRLRACEVQGRRAASFTYRDGTPGPARGDARNHAP